MKSVKLIRVVVREQLQYLTVAAASIHTDFHSTREKEGKDVAEGKHLIHLSSNVATSS